jgi:ornithine carbamoyltransferase
MGTREAIQDVGQVLARFMDVLMIRTFAHENAVKLARHAPIPVINGLTDLLHPCQVMADLMTVLEHRGSLDDMVVTWLGDGNNVAHSWINAAGILPLELRIAAPQGYEPDESIVSAARKRGAGRIEVTHDPAAAAEGADVLCTDAWASMGQEKEHQERARVMKPFQLNASLLARSKKESLVLHCLPAHRGEEITDEVLDGPRSIVFDQAENRLHAQKAILERLLA